MPVRDRQLRSNDDGSALVTVVADLQKVPAFAVFQRSHGEVVENKHVDAGELYQQPSDAAIYVRHGEFAEQLRGSFVRYGKAVAASLVRRDRVVQGAMKLILEPIFEADFQAGSYGYRPKRTAHQAVNRVAQAIVESKTRIIDIDLRAYFDNVQHYLLLEKVARRVQDDAVMHLLKMTLQATGEKGVPQGGVISPLLSNLYLTEVDRMLEKAIVTTRRGEYINVQYARFADDLVILIDAHPRHD